jgi:hypothetical protein
MKPLYLEHFLKRYDDILEEGIQMNPLPKKIKEKKKIAGTFRTREGADTFVDVMAYVGTMSKNGVGAFEAIKSAIEGRTLSLLLSATE